MACSDLTVAESLRWLFCMPVLATWVAYAAYTQCTVRLGILWPDMRCTVIIPVGPSHQAVAEQARASVETAKAYSVGPFSDISVDLIDDSQGAMGRSAARNMGINKALDSGSEWLFFLDADDLMSKIAFQSVAGYVGSYDAIWGAIFYIPPWQAQPVLRPQQVLGLVSIDQLVTYDPSLTLQMGHFIRTEVAAGKKFNESMDTGEDVDYYLRVWEDKRCIKIDNPLFIKREGLHSQGPRSATGADRDKALKDIVTGFRYRRGVPERAPRSVGTGISHVFRMDPDNPGDWFSAPMHYLPFASKMQALDIMPSKTMPEMHNTLLIGGGGLISPYFPRMAELLNQSRYTKVGWGLGNNMVNDTATGFVPKAALTWPAYADRFDLLGVRDYGSKYRWVPCASCLHPAFSIDIPAAYEVVVYEHKRVPLNISGFPRMKNDGNRIERSLEFLRSGELILTNSYHGAYWGHLLGRRVIAIPFSSKFYGFKHALQLCKPGEWKKYIDRAEAHPNALQECRQANIAFFNDFERLLVDAR